MVPDRYQDVSGKLPLVCANMGTHQERMWETHYTLVPEGCPPPAIPKHHLKLSEIHDPSPTQTYRTRNSESRVQLLLFSQALQMILIQPKLENHWSRALHTGLRIGKPGSNRDLVSCSVTLGKLVYGSGAWAESSWPSASRFLQAAVKLSARPAVI